jgi:phosphoenolpyruvate-protein phosphotransferase (PTS system enzyme I)
MTLSLHGAAISQQVAIGRARILHPTCASAVQKNITTSEVESEIDRFARAIDIAKQQLELAKDKIAYTEKTEIVGFIDAHLLMLSGSTLVEAPIQFIAEQLISAEWALKLQQDHLFSVFEAMDDPYLKSRKIDIEQVINRLHTILMGEDLPTTLTQSKQSDIVIARDLSPADILLLHNNGITGFITEMGGALSHTAILAKSLNIPAIMGIQNASQLIEENSQIIVDCQSAVLLTQPCQSVLDSYRVQQQKNDQQQKILAQLINVPCLTRDHLTVQLSANVESIEDVIHAAQTGADGVGLLRTEFLFMNRATMPTEDEHFQAYREITQHMQDKPVTIRTLDLGADKTCRHYSPTPVNNPALGLRAIRLCLADTNLFIPQIRAILRVAALSPVKLMIPMLTTIQELDSTKKIIRTQMRELTAANIAYDENIQIGGMIETPSAALCIDHFAKNLDFLSIGTNDLIQYTFAIDRVDESVNYLFTPSHPAILHLIKNIIESAKKHNVDVSLCGEMASDTKYSRLLLGLGLRQFSMSPNSILPVKNIINQTTREALRPLTSQILGKVYSREINQLLDELNQIEL